MPNRPAAGRAVTKVQAVRYVQNASIGHQTVLRVTAAIALAKIKQNGIYNDLQAQAGKGFEKEDGRSAKSAEAHLGYLCNRPYRRGLTM
jgi:hypothetical protein